MTEIKNILLIGRTGSGKSSLANVLTNSNMFSESAGSTSETKKVKFCDFDLELGSEKINYRVIDTVGIGDDQLSSQAVLYRLSEAAHLMADGVNQIFFVVNGRFTKEEIDAFKLLSSVIFDQQVYNFTTIIRTNFPDFTDENECEKDKRKLLEGHGDEFNSMRIIYVDNPAPKGFLIEISEKSREESRKRLITALGVMSSLNYQPVNLSSFNERIENYVDDKKELEMMKEAIKKYEEEINKMKTEQSQNQLLAAVIEGLERVALDYIAPWNRRPF